MSNRVRLLCILVGLLTLSATLALRLGTDVSVAAVSSTMHANVGPGFEISLTFDDGTPVLALPAGIYRVLVVDEAEDHNFHLYGPGVDQATSVETLVSTSWNVTFRNNASYFFQCDPHADSMYGKFDVGTVAADEPPSGGGSSTPGGTPAGATPAPKATGKLLATLVGSVAASGELKLTLKGKPVKTLKQGSYKIVVSDAARKDGFTLRRVGAGAATPLTGVAFVGRRTITTDLKAGQWKVYSSAHEPATAVFFRVTKS